MESLNRVSLNSNAEESLAYNDEINKQNKQKNPKLTENQKSKHQRKITKRNLVLLLLKGSRAHHTPGSATSFSILKFTYVEFESMYI